MTVDQEVRRRWLAKIHVAKKRLGLDEDTYRAMLHEVAGVDSAAQLDNHGLIAVIEHLSTKGFEGKRGKPHFGCPHNLKSAARGPMLRKIEALLAEKGKLEGRYIPWSYALGILEKQGGPEKLEWATPEQLRGVIAALHTHAKRKRRRNN